MTLTQAPVNLKGRHFLNLADFSAAEIHHLLDLSAELKAQKKAGTEVERLRQKEICLIFEKTSTRTRCSFEVAAYDQGAHVTYLDPGGSQIGHKESVKDTARVLGRIYDGIEYRGFDQELVQTWPITPACRLQRPDRRVAPDADPRGRPDDEGAQRQADRADRLRLSG